MNFVVKAVAAGVVGYAVAKVLEQYQVAEKLTALADDLLTKMVLPGSHDEPEQSRPDSFARAGDGYEPRFGGGA